MKKLIIHIIKIIGFGFFAGIFYPILNLNDVKAIYSDPVHWIIAFSAAAIVYTVVTVVHNRKKKSNNHKS